MTTSTPLLIGLAGVARLADVQRPVASMWRTRFANADDPFPAPAMQKDGRPLFNALDVARWLERTEHGNNAEAVVDAAAEASPPGFNMADADHVATLDALLTLHSVTGLLVGGENFADLAELARDADPDDLALASELANAPAAWADWADLLADAAYTPASGAHVIEQHHATTRSAAGSNGPLDATASTLLTSLASALVRDERALHLGEALEPSFVTALVRKIGEEIDVSVAASAAGRRIRRRLLCESVATAPPADAGSRLHLHRLPSRASTTTSGILRELDELVLALREDECAIVLAPSSTLTDGLSRDDDLARSYALRSGRVRAIVRLGTGLVTTAPRESLGMWVLGPPVGDAPLDDRFTAVADLTDVGLTPATIADLASDVLAAMGSAREVRAHAFRFTRLARTTSLLASKGSLVGDIGRSRTSVNTDAQTLPALIDEARAGLGTDAPANQPVAVASPSLAPARVDDLISQKHLQVIAGTRVEASEFSDHGLVVITGNDLDHPALIGARRVDPLDFAALHTSARLTSPGDIVFRTAPTARAFIDHEGSKVVAYPARVLRINSADPGGLVPELVAADIATARAGAGSWHRWMLRRVTPVAITPLRTAIADIAERRAALSRRLDALDTYVDLLTAGVVSGTVTLPDPTADTASTK